MATFAIKTVISAVDNITGPLKDINKSIRGFTKPFRDLYNSTQQLKKELGFPKVAASLRGVSKAYSGVANEVKSLGTELAVVTGAATAAVSALAWRTSSVGDAVAKTAKKVGVSSEAWSKLAYAGKMSGVEASTLQGGLTRLNKNISEAARGGKNASAMFNYLGISIYDADGKLKTADVVMSEAADKLNMIEDGAHRSAIAAELFGRSAGPEMLPLLAEGSEGIERLNHRAEELGLAWSDVDSKNAEVFGDTMEDVKGAIDGIVLTIGKQLLPILTEYGTAVVDLIIEFRKMAEIDVGEWLKGFKKEVPQIKEEIKGVVKSVSDFAMKIDGLVQSFGGWSEVMPYIAGGLAAIKLAPLITAIASLATALVGLGGTLGLVGFKLSRWIGIEKLFIKGLHRSGQGLNLLKSIFVGIGGAFKAVFLELGKGLLAFGKGFFVVAKVLGGMFVKGIFSVVAALKGLFVFMAANPITIVIAALAASAYLIYRYWGPISKWLKEVWVSWQWAAGETWDWIKTKVIAAGKAIGNFLSSLWSGITSAASSAWSAIASTIKATFTPIVAYFTERIDAVKAAFDAGLIAGIKAIVQNFSPARWIVDALDALTKLIFDFSLKDAGAHLINSMLDGLKAAWEGVVGWFGEIGKSVSGLIPESLTDVMKTMRGIGSGVTGAISGVAGSVTGAIGNWWNGAPQDTAAARVPVEQSEALQLVQQRAERQQQMQFGEVDVNFHNAPPGMGVQYGKNIRGVIKRDPLIEAAYTGAGMMGVS